MSNATCDIDSDNKDLDDSWLEKYPEIYKNRALLPKDMLALLRNVDVERAQVEANLQSQSNEEKEKLRQYKVIIVTLPMLLFNDNLIITLLNYYPCYHFLRRSRTVEERMTTTTLYANSSPCLPRQENWQN